jgi:hypothetical protein
MAPIVSIICFFEVAVKPGKPNVRPDHLSRLESGESGGAVDDQLPDADLLKVEAVPDYLSDIALLLQTGTFPEDYSATHKRRAYGGPSSRLSADCRSFRQTRNLQHS